MVSAGGKEEWVKVEVGSGITTRVHDCFPSLGLMTATKKLRLHALRFGKGC